MGTVGADDEQGDPGGVGLADGGVEVGDGRPRGGHYGGAPAGTGQSVSTGGTQRDEARAALVQDDPQAQGVRLGGVGEGVRQRGAARSRAQDCLTDAFVQEGRYEASGIGQSGRDLRAVHRITCMRGHGIDDGIGHRGEDTRAHGPLSAALHHSSGGLPRVSQG